MSLKLKALGLGLLALIATSAFTVMNASANGSGHFSFGAAHPTITVTEGEEDTGGGVIDKHKVHLLAHGLGGEIGCTEPNYTTTFLNATESSLTVAPTYAGCTTTGGSAVTVTMNGCHYVFTVASGTTDATEQTAHLVCPHGTQVEIHHPNCTIKIHPQTINTGLTYTRKLTLNKHYITLDVNIQFNTTYEAGICVFTGTNHTGTLKGAVTVEAFNTNHEKIDLTAT